MVDRGSWGGHGAARNSKRGRRRGPQPAGTTVPRAAADGLSATRRSSTGISGTANTSAAADGRLGPARARYVAGSRRGDASRTPAATGLAVGALGDIPLLAATIVALGPSQATSLDGEASDTPPACVNMSCASQFPGGMYHSGADGEGRFASTTARKGALRRGAAANELNGVSWSGWIDVPRHEPDPLPFERVTSLNAEVLEHELRDHPNGEFRAMVVHMARHGVSLGADGYVVTGPRLQPNLRSADLYPDHIRKWIGKEVDAGRLAGPFTSMPHPNLQCWGVGVIPKGGSDLADPEAKARVITHLSQESDGLPSVNATVDPAGAKVHYTRVVDAVDMIEELTANGGDPHIALVDLKAAYRNLQIHQEDLALVGIRFPNKKTGQDEFYYDRCMGFGGRASPSRFDAFASAVQWIAERRAAQQGVRCKFQHYLDDFLIAGYDAENTTAGLQILLDLFVDLGIPAEPSKTQPTTKKAVYLGIQFDLQERTVSMPIDKVTRWSAELDAIADGAASTPKKLASMAGKLGFAMVCMPAMRDGAVLRSVSASTS